MTKHDESTMRAAVVTRYGAPEVVEVREVPRPAVGPGELRVRVRATTVASGDARVRARRVPEGMELLMRLAMGWSAPRRPVLGTEFAGEVEAVGAGVTRFRVGDAVVAFPGASMGAHAEYVVVREDGLVVAKPEGCTWEEAAAIAFGGTTAVHFLVNEARVRAGERVLVLGATGAVGCAAIQVARDAGAEVTAACSAGNAELARSLGARRVLDYRTEDFTRTGDTWDVVMDCVGVTDYARCRHVLAPGGRLLRVVCGLAGLIAAPFQGRARGHRVVASVADVRRADLEALVEKVRTSNYRPVVGEVFPLARIAEAHALVDGGHKRGSAVVVMA